MHYYAFPLFKLTETKQTYNEKVSISFLIEFEQLLSTLITVCVNIPYAAPKETSMYNVNDWLDWFQTYCTLTRTELILSE